jgi:hypothetical protein
VGEGLEKRECKWCGRMFRPTFSRQVLCPQKCIKRARRQRHAKERERAQQIWNNKERRRSKLAKLHFGRLGVPSWVIRMKDHDCDKEKCDLMVPNGGRP